MIFVDIGNGKCFPDFNGPNDKEIDSDYKYNIGKDGNLVIKFKDASNGNCFFESEIDTDAPKSVMFYK